MDLNIIKTCTEIYHGICTLLTKGPVLNDFIPNC